MFRIVSYRSALERQISETVIIEEVAANPEESLNLKSKWGGSKLQEIAVSRPKGTSSKAGEIEKGT